MVAVKTELQTIAYGPYMTCHLYIYIKKLFWDTVTSIFKCIIYDCFHITVAELIIYDRDQMAHFQITVLKNILYLQLVRGFATPLHAASITVN